MRQLLFVLLASGCVLTACGHNSDSLPPEGPATPYLDSRLRDRFESAQRPQGLDCENAGVQTKSSRMDILFDYVFEVRDGKIYGFDGLNMDDKSNFKILWAHDRKPGDPELYMNRKNVISGQGKTCELDPEVEGDQFSMSGNCGSTNLTLTGFQVTYEGLNRFVSEMDRCGTEVGIN